MNVMDVNGMNHNELCANPKDDCYVSRKIVEWFEVGWILR
jgi:hypothetical protein